MPKVLLTEREIQAASRAGGVLRIDGDYVLTPTAADAVLRLGVSIEPAGWPAQHLATGRLRIAVAADHGGFESKEEVKKYIESLGYGVFDFGTHSRDAVDYPDFAHKAAAAVSERRADRAIIVDGAGIGSCMVANKVPGVLAAKCDSLSDIKNSREHNNANVLTLGTRQSVETIREMVRLWLETPFAGGRHERRVRKIEDIEKRYLARS